MTRVHCPLWPLRPSLHLIETLSTNPNMTWNWSFTLSCISAHLFGALVYCWMSWMYLRISLCAYGSETAISDKLGTINWLTLIVMTLPSFHTSLHIGRILFLLSRIWLWPAFQLDQAYPVSCSMRKHLEYWRGHTMLSENFQIWLLKLLRPRIWPRRLVCKHWSGQTAHHVDIPRRESICHSGLPPSEHLIFWPCSLTLC